ncbi:MAG: hypothetical protein WD101_03280 [Gemmatimonadota bacterium]
MNLEKGCGPVNDRPRAALGFSPARSVWVWWVKVAGAGAGRLYGLEALGLCSAMPETPLHAPAARVLARLSSSLLAMGLTALLWTIGSLSPAGVEAQLLDDRLVPAGTVRLSGWPSFTAWDERFGDDGRILLGAGLSSPSALDLFPGSADFLGEMRGLLGDPAYTPVTGAVDGRASHDVTRIEFGIHLGITDWWTIGAMLPRIKNRTAIDLVFTPDTLAGDLGVSPGITDAGAVDAFLLDLSTARADAGARADGLCAGADPSCASAQALAENAARLSSGLTTLYTATPLFPLDASAAGTVLASEIATLDTELRAAGLNGIDAPFVLATERPTESALETFPVRHSPLGYDEPLRTRTSLWSVGDVELSTLVRLLRLGDRGADVPPWSVDVLAGVLVRLGTGLGPDPDVPLSLGTGDGQTDVEVRTSAHATAGRTLSLRAGALYGMQGSRLLAMRVGVADEILVPVGRRAVYEWSPGSYLGLEVEPGLRLAPQLTLSASYRLLQHDASVFTLSDGATPAPVGRGSSLHRVGGALTYDTTAPQLDTRPLRFRLRVLRAIGGVRSPAATRVELSGELFARIWGG